MITQETAELIWKAHREVLTAEKLLADLAEAPNIVGDIHAPSLKDAFGREQHLQLGVPSGQNGHRLFRVSPTLAVSVIHAHIEEKRKELVAANERARLELSSAAIDTPLRESPDSSSTRRDQT